MIRRSVALSAFSVLALASSIASAHVVVANPPARDFGKPGADAHKTGPCGNIARTGTYTQYAMGATIPVEFTETIDHRGCFQVLLSEANDQNFTILQQIDDPAGDTTPKKRTMNVQLPAGKTCQNCTIAVRQLMINRACGTNQASINAGDTYFSCADVCIGTTCPPKSDAGAPDASAPPVEDDAGHHDHDASPAPSATGTSPAPTPTGTTPTTPGGGLEPGDSEGGCATSPIGIAGTSTVALGALGAAVVAFARRRRR